MLWNVVSTRNMLVFVMLIVFQANNIVYASRRIRGSKKQAVTYQKNAVHPDERRLLKHKHKHHKHRYDSDGQTSSQHSDYRGCLNFTSEELEEKWIFPNDAPECSFTIHSNTDSVGDNSARGEDSTWGGYNSSTSGGDYAWGEDNNFVGGEDNNAMEGENSEKEGQNDNSGPDDGYRYDGKEGNERNEVNDRNGEGGNERNEDNDRNGNSGWMSGADGNGDGNGDGDGDRDGSGNGNRNGNANYVSVFEANEYEIVHNLDDTDADPFDYFNVSKCDTYENLWLWDLSLSCESEIDLGSCECKFANDLVDMGSLTCNDIQRCPGSCYICTTCLQLMGCEYAARNAVTSASSSSSLFYVVAGQIGLFVVCLSYYYSTQYNKKEKTPIDSNLHAPLPLNAHLIDNDAHNSPIPSRAKTAINAATFLPPSPESDGSKAVLISIPREEIQIKSDDKVKRAMDQSDEDKDTTGAGFLCEEKPTAVSSVASTILPETTAETNPSVEDAPDAAASEDNPSDKNANRPATAAAGQIRASDDQDSWFDEQDNFLVFKMISQVIISVIVMLNTLRGRR